MARLTPIFVCVMFILFISCDAKKKEKHRKKSHYDFANLLDKTENFDASETDDSFDPDTKDIKRKWKKTKHSKHHHKSKTDWMHKAAALQEKMPWLDVLPDEICDMQCNKREFCILGPLDVKPMCVHMKDLKKSVKLFRKYKKKERKAWKKFQKKNYKQLKKDAYDFNHKVKDEDLWDKEKMAEKKKKLLSEDIFGEHPPEVEMPGLDFEPSEAGDPNVCSTEQFSQMRDRIMGWFHLLHSQDARAQKQQAYKKAHQHSVKKQLEAYGADHCECMKSAMWEFHEMDSNADDELTKKEMAVLEENSKEPCMRPYLTSCDSDADGKLSSDEWCCCFANVLAPCYREMNAIRKSGDSVTYMPRCDREGYFMAEQCQGKGDDKYVCWCVDYNGNVHDGTKTDGRADCSKFTTIEGKTFPQ